MLSAAAFAFAQEKARCKWPDRRQTEPAVPYASVKLSNKANKLFSDATLTDEKGTYNVALVPGNYDITIEAIDFKEIYTQQTNIKTGQSG